MTDAENKSANRTEPALLLNAVLAWVGSSITFVLLQKHSQLREMICPAHGGCDVVLSSKYSRVFGIPLPWMGAAGYLGILALILLAYATASKRLCVGAVSLAQWVAVAGVTFSAGLMFVQFRMLHAFCPLCTASAAVMVALVFAAGRAEGVASREEFAGRRAAALALGCVAFLTAAVQLLSAAAAPADAVAIVDGRSLTRAEMEEDIGPALQKTRRAAYAMEFAWVRRKVDEAILEAEASRRQMGVADLLAQRARGAGTVSDAEVEARLKSKGIAAAPASIEAARAELAAEKRERFIAELAASHRIEIFLEEPRVRFLEPDLALAKIDGPKDARVRLVVFSDFQCRVCAQLAPVLAQIRKEFPNDVMLAYRCFPLEEHARAVPAAIAAECADEQGKFREYHDRLFAEGGDLSDAKLLGIAQAVGLDVKRFEEGLQSARARQAVEASRKDADDAGLDGAPALFLNGKLVGGMIDHAKLAALVAEKLRAESAPGSR